MSAIVAAMPALCFSTGFSALLVGSFLLAIGIKLRSLPLATAGFVLYSLGLFTMMASIVYPWR